MKTARRMFTIAFFLSLPAAAQNSSASAVVVNGQLIPNRPIAGQVYVRPEDFAKAINATVAYTPQGMMITLATGEAAKPAAVNSSGTLRGTLSFYFNQNTGNKPDVGSKVYLLSGAHTVRPGDLCVPMNDQTYDLGGQFIHIVESSIADGEGNFKISSIPAGEYTIVLASNHTSMFGGMPKTLVKTLVFRPGDDMDISHDFGRTESH